jgi:hypothetical protein
MTTGKPLLESARRQVFLLVLLEIPFGIATAFPGTVSGILGVETWKVGVGGLFALVITTYIMTRLMRCPHCNVNLLWHQIGNTTIGDSIGSVLKLQECPKCRFNGTKTSD